MIFKNTTRKISFSIDIPNWSVDEAIRNQYYVDLLISSLYPVYREEIDNIFHALVLSYEKNTGRFFPLSDCPPVITLDSHPLARLDQIKLYITKDGNMYGEDTPSLITPFYS